MLSVETVALDGNFQNGRLIWRPVWTLLGKGGLSFTLQKNYGVRKVTVGTARQFISLL
jgi:hypothetical protein